MDHGSDTESEAGSLQGLHNGAGEAEDNGYRVGSHSRDTSEPQTIVQYGDVTLAIRQISQIDISVIREDSSLHQVILHSSGAIIDFLDNPTLLTDIFSIADLFSALVDVTFLSVLFEQRIVFHGIASETVERGASRSAVICWVDVVLAKLGSFALNFAGGFSPEFRDEPISITLRSRWEGECVRAASQLPQQWTSVVHVITSTHASPAAKRLSLRLMFAAYVMGPQLKGNDSWGDTRLSPSALINTLCGSLESADATPRSYHNERQQTTWALTISIFAACCTFQNINGNTSESMSPLRPRSLGQLLLMIQAIFNFDRPDGRLVVNPVENLNLPQIILIRWGKMVPWCWETWEDQRIADVECTTTLSATWLFHVDTPFLECVPLPNLADSITRRPTSASSTVRNILHCIVSGADSPNDSWCMENLSPAAGRVLSRSCWAAVRLLQINIERYDAKITAHTPDFCRCLIIIFCLLGASDGKYEVMDLVLEGLTIVGPVVLQHCLKALQEHPTLQFNARLDKSIAEVKKNITAVGLYENEEILAVKFLIDFLVLIWNSRTEGCIIRETARSILTTLLENETITRAHTSAATSLRNILLTAFAIVAGDSLLFKRFSPEQHEYLWSLALSTKCSDFIAASSFAHYVLAMEGLSDPLQCAEAWDHLRDVLLLILTRQFAEEDDPLALLICPVICLALVRLSRGDGSAARFIQHSPWTISLETELRILTEGDSLPNTHYFATLRERLEVVGKDLLQQIGQQRMTDERRFEDIYDHNTELIFCAGPSHSQLVLVSELK